MLPERFLDAVLLCRMLKCLMRGGCGQYDKLETQGAIFLMSSDAQRGHLTPTWLTLASRHGKVLAHGCLKLAKRPTQEGQ